MEVRMSGVPEATGNQALAALAALLDEGGAQAAISFLMECHPDPQIKQAAHAAAHSALVAADRARAAAEANALIAATKGADELPDLVMEDPEPRQPVPSATVVGDG